MNIDFNIYKKLSIKSRLAYAANCIENSLLKEELKSEAMCKVLDKIWAFTNTSELDEWHCEIKELLSDNILNNTSGSSDFKFFPHLYVNELRNFYSIIPKYIVKLIDKTIWIGISNLYEEVINYSEQTFNLLKDVVEIMIANKIELPLINNFLKSNFQEDFGWGINNTRDFFIPTKSNFEGQSTN